jgi:putative N6-adenine-specific DNA methylase
MYSCFATTGKGLEDLLIKELIAFGASNTKALNAGVTFTADMKTIMYANLHSRIASRIMLEVASGQYENETDIYNLAYSVNWDNWFSVDKNIKVATNAIRCDLKSIDFITLKVKDAICDKFKTKFDSRPNVDKVEPDIRIYNFLHKNDITIYIDTSGEALFKRGYRSKTQEAPLKENLAAGLIQLSNWDDSTPLIDPMCGSGTIIIEAIFIALNIAPGLNRKFAFEKFSSYNQNIFDTMKFQAKQVIIKNKNLQIYASDINPKAIGETENNLRHAKLREYVNFKVEDILNITAPGNQGTLLTNPPYGIRISETNELNQLYPLIASCLKNKFAGWNCYFFTADTNLPKLMRLKPSKKTPLFNGALDCRLYQFVMVSGSNRK